jgi:hypothetical protein
VIQQWNPQDSAGLSSKMASREKLKENLVLIETSSGVHAYFKDKPNTLISVPDEIWGEWKRHINIL